MSSFFFSQSDRTNPSTLDVELVERKGFGHPDTLADAIAEETSRRYSRYCQDRFGAIAHHWFDKVMIIGGEADTRYLRGHMVRPSLAILAGKAVLNVGSDSVPLREIFEESVAAVLGRTLKNFRFEDYCSCEIKVQNSVGPGQRTTRYRPKSISDITKLEAAYPVSNDCNLCVGFAPFTRVEALVLEVEQFLISEQQQKNRPWLGSDIKTVASRQGNRVNLLVNVPMLAGQVPNFHVYRQMRDLLQQDLANYASEWLGCSCDVDVNPEWVHGRAYLTATGTCLDTGDVGVVGRGNRHSGLITPMRSMSIEASAGKNPLDHTGKLMNIAATWISEAVNSELGIPTTTYILTKKGDRLEKPSLVAVRCDTNAELPSHTEVRVKEITDFVLSRPDRIREALLSGTAKLF